MRGDELHRKLLEQGWRWERAEEYVRDLGDVIIRLEPEDKSFPEQRSGRWDVWVTNRNFGAQLRWFWVAKGKFEDLKTFVR